MPYVPNTPEDYDVDEATDRLLERYTPGSPVEAAPRRQLHYVNHLGGTHDGLLSYNYTKKAKYALKLPERNEDCSRAPRQWDRCSQMPRTVNGTGHTGLNGTGHRFRKREN